MKETGFTASADGQRSSKPVPKDGSPCLTELFLSFLRLGLTAFGGPVMVAYIGELAVKRKKWLDQETFQRGVALCQTIPGATAMQVAAYVGVQARGLAGALCAFTGFGLPASVLMVILSCLYVSARNLLWTHAIFDGLQLMVVALAANATYTFGNGTLKDYTDILLAVVSAVLLGLGISPFYVILGTGIAGFFLMKKDKAPDSGDGRRLTVPFSHIIALLVSLIGAMICLYFIRLDLFRMALLMIKIDLFAFGGGFASVPLMLQEIVNVQAWMDSKAFMDGIALGQITPGPIVITSTFVGYLVYGLPGAVAATIAIFTPSFLLVVIGSGFIDRLGKSALFERVVKGILASFVGLLLYATVKFALAVPWNMIRVLIVCAVLAALLKKISILYIVLATALLGIILFR
jgi:chromate transporter